MERNNATAQYAAIITLSTASCSASQSDTVIAASGLPKGVLQRAAVPDDSRLRATADNGASLMPLWQEDVPRATSSGDYLVELWTLRNATMGDYSLLDGMTVKGTVDLREPSIFLSAVPNCIILPHHEVVARQTLHVQTVINLELPALMRTAGACPLSRPARRWNMPSPYRAPRKSR